MATNCMTDATPKPGLQALQLRRCCPTPRLDHEKESATKQTDIKDRDGTVESRSGRDQHCFATRRFAVYIRRSSTQASSLLVAAKNSKIGVHTALTSKLRTSLRFKRFTYHFVLKCALTGQIKRQCSRARKRPMRQGRLVSVFPSVSPSRKVLTEIFGVSVPIPA